MSIAVLGRRYAKAFFEVAVARNAVGPMQEDLLKVQDAAAQVPDLLATLSNEESVLKNRHAVVDDLAKYLQLQDATKNLLKVLIDRRRLFCFDALVRAYQALAADAAGLVTAFVTTASPLIDAQILGEVERVIGQRKHKQVKVVADVNAKLMGGVMIRVGDEIFDGSIAAELRRVREHLLRAE